MANPPMLKITMRCSVRFWGTADINNRQFSPSLTRMMLWTAPTLRHQGAIGWLRRNEPLEGSRPWARLARLVSISRSRFFTFTAWTPLARYDAVECDPWAHGRVRLYLRKGSQWHGRSAQDRR